jgi:hypothetical protein
MHAGAATQLQSPSLLMSEEQADAVTRAGARVARHYDIAVLDPKWQDWFAFAGVMAKVYGGMAMGYIGERRAGSLSPPAGYGGAPPVETAPAARAVTVPEAPRWSPIVGEAVGSA